MIAGSRFDWRLAALAAGMVVGYAAAVALPDLVPLAFLAVGPMAAATFASTRVTAGFVAAAIVLAVVAGAISGVARTEIFWFRVLAALAIGALMILLARSRSLREAELADLATTDPLTGLANRRLLTSRLDAQMRVRGRTEEAAVLYLDLDGFKAINDTWGHSVGDQVLVATGERLLTCVRAEDTVARFGGDEFVIACPNVSGLVGLDALCTRILHVMQEPITVTGTSTLVGVTIGAVMVPAGTRPDVEQLLDAADAVLVHRKAAVPGTFHIVTAEPPGDHDRV